MNCPYCHHPLSGKAPFCPNCNALLPASVTHDLPPQTEPADNSQPELQPLPLESTFTPQPAPHPPKAFPAILTGLLTFITASIFGAIKVILFLDALPRQFPDQSRATPTLLKMLVPFFNCYWLFLTFMELADRIDRECLAHHIPNRTPRRFTIVTFVILPVPLVDFAFFILFPVLCALYQAQINRLAKTSANLS